MFEIEKNQCQLLIHARELDPIADEQVHLIVNHPALHGLILALFNINDDVWSEFQTILNGKIIEPAQDDAKQEVQIKDETFSNSKEAIKDKIMKFSDREMEFFVATVLRALGYKTLVTPKTGDRGVDVLASIDGLGFQAPRIKVEVKKRKDKVDAPELRSFIGGFREGDNGLYVSTGGFSKEARYEADRSIFPCKLVDLNELADLVVENYEKFDVEGRTQLPLIKVYWPAE